MCGMSRVRGSRLVGKSIPVFLDSEARYHIVHAIT